MIFSGEGLRGYHLKAIDGRIGHIHDFLLDDVLWRVRYLVADTGWIFGRRVLLPPVALGRPDTALSEIPVDLTRDKVKDSPEIETNQPVSRQQEASLYGYYGWAPYWGAGAMAGGAALAQPLPAGDVAATESHGDPHLRSLREVVGYRVEARDGRIGSIDDFLVDDDGWQVRYVAVDTGNWLPGRKVVLAPHWAGDVDWAGRTVHIDLTRERIREAPEYDPTAFVDRPYEERLHGHYGYAPYW